MIAGPPPRDVVLPAAVAALVGRRKVVPVWQTELGAVTFQATDGEQQFIKWVPRGSGIDVTAEVVRLRWATRFVTVPQVLDYGGDDDGAWIVTRALLGESAVAERWKREPAVAVRAMGEGLRSLHDALPVGECPFSWSATDRVEEVQRRLADGRFDVASWRPDRHGGLALDDAVRVVRDVPPIDQAVVCHGDACAPNTLLADDGTCCGHVDLGALGVADRWADLAIATWSTEWNYGPGWDDALLDAYGVNADRDRTQYYRLLWDLGP